MVHILLTHVIWTPHTQVDQEGSLLLQRSGNPGYLNGQPVLAGVASGSYPNSCVSGCDVDYLEVGCHKMYNFFIYQ